MWLLDANMDVHLITVLKDLGVSSATAGEPRMEGFVEWRFARSGCVGRFRLPAYSGPAIR
jgi:hypothetical protein